jgi:hypothetical protein
MSRPRKDIGLKTKLAAAVRELLRIPMDHARLMTEDQMLSLVQWDHIILHTPPYNGTDDHWNIDPLSIMKHRAKTATVDVPRIAKGRRLADAEQSHRARMLLPASVRKAEKPKSRWPQGRKIPSRKKGKS